MTIVDKKIQRIVNLESEYLSDKIHET